MMFANSRVRAALAVGTALVVVAGIGIGVANSSSAASARFVTATVGTGDVVQTYTATGTITRKNTEVAAFPVDGTVKSVAVAVGATVEAGDVLATLKRGPLQLAVLNADTSVAQAEASLYAARNPSSTSGGSGSAGSASAGGSGNSTSSGTGSGTGSGGTTITIDPIVLNETVSRINLAVLAEAQTCEPVFGSILPAAEPTATPTASATPTAMATASATASPTASESATAEPTVTPAAAPAAQQATTAAVPEPTASASQLDAIEANDPTKEELQACANARAEVLAANTNLQTVVAALTTPKPATPPATVKKPSSPSASSSSVSARSVAAARADLLKARQDLQAADDALDAATLRTPISGTVGLVGLAKGDAASGGTITIVGSGSAVVTVELPLSTRNLVTVGQEVTVTPAGSLKTILGRLTAINSLETSGTSGSAPTYATTVAVSDPDQLLATGAKASVAIAVKSVTGIVRLPASAVTPTGPGTATVQVVATATADTASSVGVKTGAVGAGWVEITEGLEAGKLVVLADSTAAIPTNADRRRTTTSTSTASSQASAPATAAAAPSSGGTVQASVQPTATATKK